MNKLKSLSLVLCFSLFFCANSFAQSWQQVGNSCFSEDASSSTMTMTSSGQLYTGITTYTGPAITVMEYVSPDWVTIGTPDFGSGYAAAALVPDGSNTPYVLGGNINGDVVFKFDGTNWNQLGSAISNIGSSAAMTSNSSGVPYVATLYSSVSGTTCIVKQYNGSYWAQVGGNVSANTVSNLNMAFSTNDTLFVAYSDNAAANAATVMKYNGSSWVTVGHAGFSPGAVNYLSMVIDPGGTPWVAFEDGENGNKATVMKYADTGWVIVGIVGFSSGIVTNVTMAFNYNNNEPYVLYTDEAYTNRATIMKFHYGTQTWEPIGVYGFTPGPTESNQISTFNSGTIYYVYTDGSCSSEIDGVKATMKKYVGDVGVPDVNATGISMAASPNPNDGSFTLKLSSVTQENATIIITNVLGEKIQELEIPTNTEAGIQLDAPTGLYFINAKTATNNQSTKIIINK